MLFWNPFTESQPPPHLDRRWRFGVQENHNQPNTQDSQNIAKVLFTIHWELFTNMPRHWWYTVRSFDYRKSERRKLKSTNRPMRTGEAGPLFCPTGTGYLFLLKLVQCLGPYTKTDYNNCMFHRHHQLRNVRDSAKPQRHRLVNIFGLRLRGSTNQSTSRISLGVYISTRLLWRSTRKVWHKFIT